MTFLIDNQLPPALAKHLQSLGAQAEHVADRNLQRATDVEIWEHAKANACIIVTKDEDFANLAASDPDGPPVVWVRLGNCRTETLQAAFDRVFAQVQRELVGGAKLLEIH